VVDGCGRLVGRELTSSEFDASEESESCEVSEDSDETFGFLVDRLVVVVVDGCDRFVVVVVDGCGRLVGRGLAASEFDASEESELRDGSEDSDEICGFLVDRCVVFPFVGCGCLVGREYTPSGLDESEESEL
jgi:hypothetical protein